MSAVWQWGLSWLGLGLLCFGLLGWEPFVWALLLAVSICVYDAIHKLFALAPVLMAGCRFLLILLAASVAEEGVVGYAIWTAAALAGYIVGLSYMARKESRPAPVQYWPCVFLAAPLILALVVNRGPMFWGGCFFELLLLGWIVYSLGQSLWAAQPNVGRTVSGLLAGIVLVDLLAVWNWSFLLILGFLLLFAMALGFQRFIPAT